MQQIGRLNSLPLILGLSLDTFWSWSGVGLGHWSEGDFKNQASWSWCSIIIIVCPFSNATNKLHLRKKQCTQCIQVAKVMVRRNYLWRHAVMHIHNAFFFAHSVMFKILSLSNKR